MTNASILIVEDDEKSRNLMMYILEREGFQFDFAVNGPQAIEKAIFSKPELILMDIMIPIINGMHAARKIRQCPEMVNTSIIFTTALASRDIVELVINMKNVDYVRKPIRRKILIEKIRNLLGGD